ncbi:MAG: transposase [Planctomycetes bacterium]|nr:transposase [Planctomycetota bacterium]
MQGSASERRRLALVLEPVVARSRDLAFSKYFRGDAAFAIPELYAFLEADNYLYASRLKSNAALERQIGHLLTRPVVRPPKKPVVRCHDLMYRARSCDRERRVVVQVEWRQGELFPRVGVRFYKFRGTAEQWIKEGKNAIEWTKLSCHDFVDNQVPLQLFALASAAGELWKPPPRGTKSARR